MRYSPVVFLILLVSVVGFNFKFENGNSLLVNSSFAKHACSVTIESQGQQDSTFTMHSEALSPTHGKHTFTHGEKGFKVTPELSEEVLLVNLNEGESHLIALQHKLHQNITDSSAHSHFLPIDIEKDGKKYDFLLPMFDLQFSFLAENSFYRCQNVIFSIQYDEQMVDIALFSKTKQNTFNLQGKWDSSWRKSDRGYNFGRYTRHISNSQTIINISNRKQCKFHLDELEKYEVKPLEMQRYYKFDEILRWAREMPSKEIMVEQEL